MPNPATVQQATRFLKTHHGVDWHLVMDMDAVRRSVTSMIAVASHYGFDAKGFDLNDVSKQMASRVLNSSTTKATELITDFRTTSDAFVQGDRIRVTFSGPSQERDIVVDVYAKLKRSADFIEYRSFRITPVQQVKNV